MKRFCLWHKIEKRTWHGFVKMIVNFNHFRYLASFRSLRPRAIKRILLKAVVSKIKCPQIIPLFLIQGQRWLLFSDLLSFSMRCSLGETPFCRKTTERTVKDCEQSLRLQEIASRFGWRVFLRRFFSIDLLQRELL